MTGISKNRILNSAVPINGESDGFLFINTSVYDDVSKDLVPTFYL